MNYRLWIAAAIIGASATPLFAQEKTGNYNDTYGVLSSRNMFLRERHKPYVREPRTSSPRPDTTSPQAIEKAIVLRGVAIENDELHAYLENTRTSKLIRVAPGDSIASGHIVEIAIDAIAYEVEGRAIWVEIGQNLSGARMSAEMIAASTPTTSPSADGAPTTPSPSGSSLEERMKLRRMQQRGGK
ncbi:MAG: hypothetical protein JWM57_1883 [Phycisphaerales bacterium]|nr:hypothetical protein [Phycisphaerales bacterium]